MIPSLLFLFIDSYLCVSLFWSGFRESPLCLIVGITLLQVFFLAQLWLYFLFFKSSVDTKLKFEKPIQTFAFYSMGFISFLFTFTFIRDFFAPFLLIFGNAHLFYGELPTNLILTLSFICFLVGVFNARFRILSPRVEVVIPRLPDALIGLRIVQLSDIHLGTGPKVAQVKQMVDRALSLDADIIALTGDIIDGMTADLASEMKELARLRAKHGVYFILGNHECYWKPLDAIEAMRKAEISPLLNEGITIEIKGEAIFIAGVNDPSFAHFGGEGPRVPTPPSNSVFNLALMHQPQFAADVAKQNYHLQLSGHTHGGQFFPWNLIVRGIYHIHAGLGKVDDLWVYVNQGTGYWGPPIRLGTDGEVTELILKK